MSDLLELKRGDVHLWYVQTENAKQRGWLVRYQDLMSGDERERQQRFVFEKDRDQFLMARALQRKTLSRYLPEQPADWRFQTNEFGKPEIDSSQNPSQLRFNISHCDGLVVCVVTIGCDVGVDCECIDRKIEFELLAPRVFTESECKYLDSVPGDQRTETFFRLWTLKEAYLKARGIGMSLSLREISFDISVETQASISFGSKIDDRPQAWQFLQPSFPAPFMTALAVNLPIAETLNLEVHEA